MRARWQPTDDLGTRAVGIFTEPRSPRLFDALARLARASLYPGL